MKAVDDIKIDVTKDRQNLEGVHCNRYTIELLPTYSYSDIKYIYVNANNFFLTFNQYIILRYIFESRVTFIDTIAENRYNSLNLPKILC